MSRACARAASVRPLSARKGGTPASLRLWLASSSSALSAARSSAEEGMAAESNLGVGWLDLCVGCAPSVRAEGEACAPALAVIANKRIKTQNISRRLFLVAGKRQSSAFHL